MTPIPVSLLFATANSPDPTAGGLKAFAEIVEWTDERFGSELFDEWWSDPAIDQSKVDGEIDRSWDWTGRHVDYEGIETEIRSLAVVTGDGAVQGAMWITAQPVRSDPVPGFPALFIERLFSAPRNRPNLLKSAEQPIFFGVGSELLRVGIELSRACGGAGRLRLEASPGAIAWYRRRGFLPTNEPAVDYDSVEYQPMEMSAAAADRFLAD